MTANSVTGEMRGGGRDDGAGAGGGGGGGGRGLVFGFKEGISWEV